MLIESWLTGTAAEPLRWPISLNSRPLVATGMARVPSRAVEGIGESVTLCVVTQTGTWRDLQADEQSVLELREVALIEHVESGARGCLRAREPGPRRWSGYRSSSLRKYGSRRTDRRRSPTPVTDLKVPKNTWPPKSSIGPVICSPGSSSISQFSRPSSVSTVPSLSKVSYSVIETTLLIAVASSSTSMLPVPVRMTTLPCGSMVSASG